MFNIEYNKNPQEYSALSLAYIGDAVYEVYVRSRIMSEHADMPPAKLHRLSTEFVKASAQAEAVKSLTDHLSEKELTVFKRGRNAKPHTSPKNADISDYRFATGFEALVGYLYLSKNFERTEEIMRRAYDSASIHSPAHQQLHQ
ncbi:MAG: ribonuclease III [Oscillospiraceae bacterium]|nr:ribonuclease III [Oscillospiraceae bacterium]